ncbi:MAG: TIR domain-containing protein [Firmicutes bacterium]|nr:TIR domain-containing protein [Bacillota bacterium]
MDKYLAFISYRHREDDQDAALKLRKLLEGLHLPKDCPIPLKRKVFRDTDELPTSADLGTDIENALKDSGYLIALCSEGYVTSRWCRREVELFIESGRKDRILPVLISGSPEASVPEEIRDLPVVFDLRDEGEKYDKGRARPAAAALLSAMSGVTPQRFMRSDRLFRTGAASAAVLCVAAGILGFAAYASDTADRIEKNNGLIAAATEETEAAERQAVEERDANLLRQAEYISSKAWGLLSNDDADGAIELALSALPDDLHGDLPVSQEAVAVLRTALSMETVPSYHLFASVETDYDIDSYYIYDNLSDRIFLTEDHINVAEHYIDYKGNTGDLETDMSQQRQNAIDLGYTKLCYLAGDVNARRLIFCGGGCPLYSEGSLGYYRTDYTLKGEPFPSDGMACGDARIAAWNSRADGSGSCTALFKIGEPEALAVLDIKGVPVSVSFSGNGSSMLIIDDTGTLYAFGMDGTLKKCFGDGFSCALYLYNSEAFVYAGREDGTLTCYSLDRMEEVYTIDCGHPVKEIRANRDRKLLLVNCGGGVSLYHLVTGRPLSRITDDSPDHVLFQNDRGNSGSDTRMILMIYGRRIDLYGIDTDIERSVSDYKPLIAEGIPAGKYLYYSQDGKRVFQYETQGINFENEAMLYCWDAETGTILWQRGNERRNYGSYIVWGDDGRTSWILSDGSGEIWIERFDEVTGETVLSSVWKGVEYQPVADSFTLSPDGSKGFCFQQLSSTSTLNCTESLVVFDASSGGMLWQMVLERRTEEWRAAHGGEYDITWAEPEPGVRAAAPSDRSGFAQAMFSKDGRELFLIQRAVRSDDGASGYAVDRIDVLSGRIREEVFLEMSEQEVFIWEEEGLIVLIDEQPDEVNKPGRSIMRAGVWYYPTYTGEYEEVTVAHTVSLYDPEKAEFRARVPFSYRRSPEAYNQALTACRPSEGGMALYWEARNDDDDGERYCCRLYSYGSLGPVTEADSEEGRRLWIPAENCLVFQGEEVYIDDQILRRISDGSTVLAGLWTSTVHVISDAGTAVGPDSFTDRSLAAAPDGSSICVYSRYGGNTRYPFLVFPSDLDTLVEKGKKRLNNK